MQELYKNIVVSGTAQVRGGKWQVLPMVPSCLQQGPSQVIQLGPSQVPRSSCGALGVESTLPGEPAVVLCPSAWWVPLPPLTTQENVQSPRSGLRE